MLLWSLLVWTFVVVYKNYAGVKHEACTCISEWQAVITLSLGPSVATTHCNHIACICCSPVGTLTEL